MSNPACILVFGRDPSLLETRCLVLRSTGGVVHATTKLVEAERILDQLKPDLMVLCYTLSAQEREAILGASKRHDRGMRTLTLTADGKPELHEGDHDIFAGARAFKTRVMEILSRDQSLTEQQLAESLSVVCMPPDTFLHPTKRGS